MRPARLTTEGDSLLFPAGEEAGELGQSSLFSSCRFLKHQPLGISSYFSRGSMKIHVRTVIAKWEKSAY